MQKNIHSETELELLAQEILAFAKGYKIFLLKGNLGTGKTTLTKQICKQLGVQGQTASPTYSIVNEYIYPKGKIYHIDLYRLQSEEEAFEVGLEDYIDSNEYCFIEWPDLAENFLPNKYVEIAISKISDQNRLFDIKKR